MKSHAQFLLTISLPTLIFLFSGHCLFGQQKIDHTDSKEYLVKGFEYYNDQKYAQAIEKYLLINRNDTNYQIALSEIAICQFNLEKYEDAIATNKKAIETAEELQPDMFINLGNSYDLAGKKTEALETFDAGLKLFPKNHVLYFNKAITYYNWEKYDEALINLKKAIEINPSHPGSHLSLGAIAANEGKVVQAMLSYNTFLLLEPEGERALGVLSYLNEIAGGGIKDDEAKGIKLSDGDDFSDVELIISNQLALSAKYKVKADFQYDIIKQNHVLFEKLEFIPNDKGFWMQTYVPFYKKLFEEGWYEDFANFILLSSDNEKVQATLKKNISGLKKFNDWQLTNWYQMHREHTDLIAGKKQKVDYYYNNNSLQFIGKSASDVEFKPEGDAEIYHESGALASYGKYLNGVRTGRWVFFATDGKKNEEADYKEGKLNGKYISYYENGNISAEATYKDDLLDGEVKNYFRSGDIYTIENFKAGKLNGKATTYYRSGKIDYEATYIDGDVSGHLTGYYPDGTKKQEAQFKDNMREGMTTEYYRNGKVESEQNYGAGKTNGAFTEYHENGKISEEGVAKDGNLIGEYKVYGYDGKLLEMTNYDQSGKLNGVTKAYDWDGKLYYEWIYTKGEITEYKYYNKEGEIVGQGKRKLTKFPFIGYFPDGTKKFEGDYDGSEQNGIWKYYDRFGNVETENTYKDGELDGPTKKYYANGQLASKTNYEKGNKEGLFESYYITGRIREHGWYVKDLAEGDWINYAIDGTITSHSYFVNDLRNGWQADYDVNGKLYEDELYEYDYAYKAYLHDTSGNRIDTIELTVPEAAYTYTHYNGKKCFNGKYRNGEANGEFIWYFSNGQVNTKGSYLEGQRDGKWEWYFEKTGKIKFEAFYDMGGATGVWHDYYENGQLEYIRTFVYDEAEGEANWFHENGKQHIKGQFVNGNRHGAFYYYDELGQLQIIKYYEHGKEIAYAYNGTDGKPVAMKQIVNGSDAVTAFYQNGKKSMEYTLKNGEKDGKYVEYFSNGNIWEDAVFKNGFVHGNQKMYYVNGKLQSDENYYYDELDGLSTYYFKDGKTEKTIIYRIGTKHGKAQNLTSAGKVEKTIIYYDGKVFSE